MKNPLAIIRASASPKVGGGHIVRCMALARELTLQGWSCTFVSGADTLSTIPMVSEYDILEIDESDPLHEPEFIRRLIGRNVPVLIVDHYERGYEFETRCRQWADKIVILSDVPSRPFNADLLLDQSGGRTPDDYSGLLLETSEQLLGPDYSLLRPQFSEHHPGDSRISTILPPRIFISMGATDERNLTGFACDIVLDVLSDAYVDVMLSAQAPHLLEIQERCDRNDRFALHVGSSDPAPVMAKATFAIGTAGINLWERCALGIPSIIFVAAENQRANANYVVAKGGGLLVGVNEARSPNRARLEAAIGEMLRNQEGLISMSKAAQLVCDGRGAKRVADKISAMIGLRF